MTREGVKADCGNGHSKTGNAEHGHRCKEICTGFLLIAFIFNTQETRSSVENEEKRCAGGLRRCKAVVPGSRRVTVGSRKGPPEASEFKRTR